jgi:hypothetical protein
MSSNYREMMYEETCFENFYSIGNLGSKALHQPYITFRYLVDIFVVMPLLWNLRDVHWEWLYLLCLRDIPIMDVGSGVPRIVTFLKDSWNCYTSSWLWHLEGKVCMILPYPYFERNNCCDWQPCISNSNFNISNEDWMHIHIITTTLLMPYHSDMFQPSKGHQGVLTIHFKSKVN